MSYLFFDVTHHIFSFTTLFVLPEGRRFLKADLRQRRSRYVLCIAVFFAFAAWKTVGLLKQPLPPIVVDIGTAFVVFLWARHSLGQTFGISLLFNQAARKNGDEQGRAQLATLEKKERFLFQLFLFVGILSRFNSRAHYLKTGYEIDTVVSIALGLIAFAILFLTFRIPGPAFLRKKLFLTRLFFYPLVFWSPLAGLALGSMHGSEYLLLSASIAKRSSHKWARYLPIGLAILGALLIVPVFISMYSKPALEMFGTWTQLPKPWLFPLIVFFFTLENLHYYVDSFIYRMNEPAVRDNLLPLMTPGLEEW